MPTLELFECDACEKRVPMEEGHGWLAVQTMVRTGAKEKVAKRHATLCSLDCLADWVEDQAIKDDAGETEMMAAPAERSRSGGSLAELLGGGGRGGRELDAEDASVGQYL